MPRYNMQLSYRGFLGNSIKAPGLHRSPAITGAGGPAVCQEGAAAERPSQRLSLLLIRQCTGAATQVLRGMADNKRSTQDTPGVPVSSVALGGMQQLVYLDHSGQCHCSRAACVCFQLLA